MGNKLLCGGDCHGNFIFNWSKRHRKSIQLEENDVAFVAGDFGLPFGTENPAYRNSSWGFHHNKYQLDWIERNIPCPVVAVLGNHEDWPWWQKQDLISKWDAHVRQCVFDGHLYENVFAVDVPQLLTVHDKHIWCIPGADSHDADNLLDPTQPDYKQKAHNMRKYGRWFRTVGWDWHPEEKIDTALVDSELESFLDTNIEVDCIISHDCPAWYLTYAAAYNGLPRFKATEGEECLERVRQALDGQTSWVFGHLHQDYDVYDSRLDKDLHCVYHRILDMDDLPRDVVIP